MWWQFHTLSKSGNCITRHIEARLLGVVCHLPNSMKKQKLLNSDFRKRFKNRRRKNGLWQTRTLSVVCCREKSCRIFWKSNKNRTFMFWELLLIRRRRELSDFHGNIKICVLFSSWNRFEKDLFCQNENSRIKCELLNTAFKLQTAPFSWNGMY